MLKSSDFEETHKGTLKFEFDELRITNASSLSYPIYTDNLGNCFSFVQYEYAE